MSKRTTVFLTDDAAAQLAELAGSTRKQGDYLSSLIAGVYANRQVVSEGLDLESLRWNVQGLAAGHRGLEARLLQVEKQLAAMMAKA